MGLIKTLTSLLFKMSGNQKAAMTQKEIDAAKLDEARKWLKSRSGTHAPTPPQMKMTDDLINPHKSHLLNNIHHDK